MKPIEKYMDVFTQSELQPLLAEQAGPCVSLYMPTEKRGSEIEQNPIRFKNLITETRNKLSAYGLERQAIENLTAPMLEADSVNFWRYQSDGLALFSAPNVNLIYRLPYPFSEQVIIDEAFYIRPLLPLVAADERFYVLALNQGNVQLYQGSRYRIGEVNLESVPNSLSEALRYDDFERQVQFHTGTAPGVGDRSAMFHGHGTAGDEATAKENILRFFRELDNGIRDLLGDQQAPLVLTGIDSLRGLYREANQYRCLIADDIATDPQTMDDAELHDEAWAIVEPGFTQDRQEALDQYQQLAGSDDERAANTLQRIVPAAHFQRVATLFIVGDEQRWGTFDPQANRLAVHAEHQTGDTELINMAARHTLLNGGMIYTLAAGDLATPESVAAILRY